VTTRANLTGNKALTTSFAGLQSSGRNFQTLVLGAYCVERKLISSSDCGLGAPHRRSQSGRLVDQYFPKQRIPSANK